ncbi:MAG: hypothetical protein KGD64_09040, partial [Candidatus Heimdallarchaeota archaeon]|nr:hypothetical protein [Candidatus Heimdallarchaeota archaeon]
SITENSMKRGDLVANSNYANKKGKKNINDIKGEKQKESIKDFSQTKEIVKALSEEVGVLVEQFLNAIYNIDVADSFADAIVTIYKKLLAEGITKQTAEKIICEYSANLDRFASMLKKQED